MNKNRIEAFSDGVFAIVVTIMVFEIKIPHVPVSELNRAVLAVIPKILAYVLSFIIIGVYWVSHHNMLHFIEKVDRSALWLNNLVLLTVALIPFPTSLLGDYPGATLPILVYSITLSSVNFAGTLLWAYSSFKNRLTVRDLNPKFSRKVIILHSSPIIFYISAVFLSNINVLWSYIIYFLVPLFFILPNPILKRILKNPYIEK